MYISQYHTHLSPRSKAKFGSVFLVMFAMALTFLRQHQQELVSGSPRTNGSHQGLLPVPLPSGAVHCPLFKPQSRASEPTEPGNPWLVLVFDSEVTHVRLIPATHEVLVEGLRSEPYPWQSHEALSEN
jgi:hypothetical protein